MVSVEDFAKLDIRIGKIRNVEDVPLARKPLYKLTVYLGDELGERTIVAGIGGFYKKDELLNKKVVCIVNLDKKSIAGIDSNGMLLAAEDKEIVTVLQPEKDVAEGSRIR